MRSKTRGPKTARSQSTRVHVVELQAGPLELGDVERPEPGADAVGERERAEAQQVEPAC